MRTPRIQPILHVAAGLSPALLFGLVLVLPVPAFVSRSLGTYSLPLFLSVLALYFLSFRASARVGWLVATAVTMLLLGLSLSFLWNSGYSDDKIIGGLLPFRDALDYFNGADWILGGRAIRIINEGAAWRPLYPGFLSGLLWVTGRNLQIALAVQVAIAGLCFSMAAVRVWSRLGPLAGALFATLLYFYIQPLIGTAYTETLGMALGCLGFVLLSDSAEKMRTGNMMAGIVVLVLAVSARAGAFFIFPALVVWAGWAWRGAGRFSVRQAVIALSAALVTLLAVNALYGRLVVEPGGSPLGNFAFTLYGQVNGGAGYHRAFEDLAVRDPQVILRAAWRFFLAHPQGLVVGSLKAYRDFVSPLWGIFSLGSGLQDMAVSVAASALLLAGIFRAVRQIAEGEASLLIASLLGILFSVPFLPPIDGGIRIYASTIPFIHVLAALGLGIVWPTVPVTSKAPVAVPAGMLSAAIGVLMLIVPPILRHTMPAADVTAAACTAENVSFSTVVSTGSYIDLVPPANEVCGALPQVCATQLQSYAAGNDPSDKAVFDELVRAARTATRRVFVGNDLLEGRPHVFVVPLSALPEGSTGLISGCAVETQIKGRPSIYAVQ